MCYSNMGASGGPGREMGWAGFAPEDPETGSAKDLGGGDWVWADLFAYSPGKGWERPHPPWDWPCGPSGAEVIRRESHVFQAKRTPFRLSGGKLVSLLALCIFPSAPLRDGLHPDDLEFPPSIGTSPKGGDGSNRGGEERRRPGSPTPKPPKAERDPRNRSPQTGNPAGCAAEGRSPSFSANSSGCRTKDPPSPAGQR